MVHCSTIRQLAILCLHDISLGINCGLDVFMTGNSYIVVFWCMTPCSLVSYYQPF
jgi:hypothetical protein